MAKEPKAGRRVGVSDEIEANALRLAALKAYEPPVVVHPWNYNAGVDTKPMVTMTTTTTPSMSYMANAVLGNQYQVT